MSESIPLDRRTVALDVTGLLSIPLFLVVLHFLVPASLHDQLIFYHQDPSALTAWTSAFFHQSVDHLQSNLLGYVTAIAPTYILYAYWGRRRTFWLTVVTLLVAVPLVTSMVDLWIFSTQFSVTDRFNSQGFSGIASAFGGMLLASIGLFLADEYDRWTGVHAVNLVVILSFGVLGFASGILSPLVAGLVVVGVALVGSQFVEPTWVREPGRLVAAARAHRGPLFVAGYGGLAVCWIVPAIFPVDVTQGGTLTNIFAHGIGFGTGAVVAWLVATVSFRHFFASGSN